MKKWLANSYFDPQKTFSFSKNACLPLFKIGIISKDEVTNIWVEWQVLSRDYIKLGKFRIKVVPIYEEIQKAITVYDSSEVKETEVVITPKIIKE